MLATTTDNLRPAAGAILALVPADGVVEFADRVDKTSTFYHPLVAFALVVKWTGGERYETALSPVVVTGTEVTTADQLVDADEDYQHTYWRVVDPLLDSRPLPRAMRERHEEGADDTLPLYGPGRTCRICELPLQEGDEGYLDHIECLDDEHSRRSGARFSKGKGRPRPRNRRIYSRELKPTRKGGRQ